MAKNEIKYKDIRVGRDVYTVKLRLMRCGGIYNGTAVSVDVMTWHLPPRNFWERLAEWWRYSLNTWTWDPQISEASLEAFVTDVCNYETVKKLRHDTGEEEWAAM